MYTYIHTPKCIYIYTYIHLHFNKCTPFPPPTHTCALTCTCTCTFTHTYKCLYVRLHPHAQTHPHMRTVFWTNIYAGCLFMMKGALAVVYFVSSLYAISKFLVVTRTFKSVFFWFWEKIGRFSFISLFFFPPFLGGETPINRLGPEKLSQTVFWARKYYVCVQRGQVVFSPWYVGNVKLVPRRSREAGKLFFKNEVQTRTDS